MFTGSRKKISHRGASKKKTSATQAMATAKKLQAARIQAAKEETAILIIQRYSRGYLVRKGLEEYISGVLSESLEQLKLLDSENQSKDFQNKLSKTLYLASKTKISPPVFSFLGSSLLKSPFSSGFNLYSGLFDSISRQLTLTTKGSDKIRGDYVKHFTSVVSSVMNTPDISEKDKKILFGRFTGVTSLVLINNQKLAHLTKPIIPFIPINKPNSYILLSTLLSEFHFGSLDFPLLISQIFADFSRSRFLTFHSEFDSHVLDIWKEYSNKSRNIILPAFPPSTIAVTNLVNFLSIYSDSKSPLEPGLEQKCITLLASLTVRFYQFNSVHTLSSSFSAFHRDDSDTDSDSDGYDDDDDDDFFTISPSPASGSGSGVKSKSKIPKDALQSRSFTSINAALEYYSNPLEWYSNLRKQNSNEIHIQLSLLLRKLVPKFFSNLPNLGNTRFPFVHKSSANHSVPTRTKRTRQSIPTPKGGTSDPNLQRQIFGDLASFSTHTTAFSMNEDPDNFLSLSSFASMDPSQAHSMVSNMRRTRGSITPAAPSRSGMHNRITVTPLFESPEAFSRAVAEHGGDLNQALQEAMAGQMPGGQRQRQQNLPNIFQEEEEEETGFASYSPSTSTNTARETSNQLESEFTEGFDDIIDDEDDSTPFAQITKDIQFISNLESQMKSNVISYDSFYSLHNFPDYLLPPPSYLAAKIENGISIAQLIHWETLFPLSFLCYTTCSTQKLSTKVIDIIPEDLPNKKKKQSIKNIRLQLTHCALFDSSNISLITNFNKSSWDLLSSLGSLLHSLDFRTFLGCTNVTHPAPDHAHLYISNPTLIPYLSSSIISSFFMSLFSNCILSANEDISMTIPFPIIDISIPLKDFVFKLIWTCQSSTRNSHKSRTGWKPISSLLQTCSPLFIHSLHLLNLLHQQDSFQASKTKTQQSSSKSQDTITAAYGLLSESASKWFVTKASTSGFTQLYLAESSVKSSLIHSEGKSQIPKATNVLKILASSGKAHAILNTVPFVVPLPIRLRIFQKGVLKYRSGASTSVLIHRKKLLLDTIAALQAISVSQARGTFSVKFIDVYGATEMGGGPGLFKEWITSVATHCFVADDLPLFIRTSDGFLYPNPHIYRFASVSGLTPKYIASAYVTLGKIVSIGFLNGIILPIRFSPFFLSLILGKKPNLLMLREFDPTQYRSLLSLKNANDSVDVEQVYSLTFSVTERFVGRTFNVDLIPDGSSKPVTNQNKDEFIHRLLDYRLRRSFVGQAQLFATGLFSWIKTDSISMFQERELDLLISGSPGINIKDLRDHCGVANHTGRSDAIVDRYMFEFWKIIENLDPQSSRQFLKFFTGTEAAPLFGFGDSSPKPQVNVHRDLHKLPTAATCFNLLKLPFYGIDNSGIAKLKKSIMQILPYSENYAFS